MADGSYTSIDGIEIENITAEFGPILRSSLLFDPFTQNLTFPRLRLAAFPGLGYSPVDYWQIAEMIGPDGIQVYKTKSTKDAGSTPDDIFHGRYVRKGKTNFFVLNAKMATAATLDMKTLVHETTHAIQDWKKWRESPLDMEIDGHFAAALYLVGSGMGDAKTDVVMNYFMIGAQAYFEDPKCVTSRWFRGIYEKMKNDVRGHYYSMHKKLNPKFEDAETYLKAFSKKERLDGIPG